jgi:hypothetical protein
MIHRASLLVAAALVMAACSDRSPFAQGDGRPQATLADAGTGSLNPYFSFQTPLVERTGGTGTFNPNLSPTVVVCEVLSADDCDERARWTKVRGPGSERVQRGRENDNDFYMQLWRASDFAAAVGTTYRIGVLLGDALLGQLDVRFYETEAQRTEALAAGALPRLWEQDWGVPIRFRIEQGALAAALGTTCGTQCTEASVTPGEETVVTTPNKRGGVEFSASSLEHTGADPINVLVSLVNLGANQNCLPTDLKQYGGCFRVNVDRSISLAPNTVVVGVCLDPAKLAQGRHNVLLGKASEDGEGNPTGTVKVLEGRPAPFLDCNGSLAFQGSDHALARFARAALRLVQPAVSLVAPTALHAYDVGMGCDPVWELNAGGRDDMPFSRFGYAYPVLMEMVSGDGQVGAPGETLLPPTVQLFEAHGGGDHPSVAANVPVVFTFTGPGMLPSTVEVLSDTDGIAWAEWILGDQPGDYYVTVTAPGSNIAGVPVPTVNFMATVSGQLTFDDVTRKLRHRWLAESNANDAVGTAHGVEAGTVGYGAGKFGQAFSFAGNGSVDLGTGASLGGSVNFSIEAWVKTSGNGRMSIINQRGSSAGDGEYMLNIGAARNGTVGAGKVYFTVYNQGFQWELVSNVTVNDDAWYHIVAVRHGAQGYLYVNGELQASASGGVKHLVGSLPARIGADNAGSAFFNGAIDHVGIYGHALRAAEVMQLYCAGVDCCPAGGCP